MPEKAHNGLAEPIQRNVHCAAMKLPTRPSAQRKKRDKAPKHSGTVRAYRFAMDAHGGKAAPLFGAAETLGAVRNDIVGLLDDRRG